MSWLPPAASDLERLEAVWTDITGQGLALSHLDAVTAAAWLDAAPLEVVTRALEAAVKRLGWDVRPGRAPARSLRACARDVQAAIQAYRARAVGGRHG